MSEAVDALASTIDQSIGAVSTQIQARIFGSIGPAWSLSNKDLSPLSPYSTKSDILSK